MEKLNIKSLQKYFSEDLGWGDLYESRIVFKFLCDGANISKGGIVVDAGAGFQRYKPFFQESIYLAMEHPLSGLKEKNINEYDILSDATDMPIKDESVDLVLSTSSLEHIENPHLFFKEAFRILKPGGFLFINVPFEYEEHEAPYDFQRPTRYGLRSWFQSNNFQQITIKPTSSTFYTTLYFFQLAFLFGYRKSKGLLKKSFQRILLKLNSFLTKILMKFLDFSPHEDEWLPIGWIGNARKPGLQQISAKTISKAEIIASIYDPQKGVLLNNTIVANAFRNK